MCLNLFRKSKLLCCFLVVSSSLFAQDEDEKTIRNNLWFSTSGGLALHSIDLSVTGDFSIEYSRKNSLYSFQFMSLFDIPYPPFLLIRKDDDYNNVNSLGLLYGHIHKFEIVKFSYSAGLAMLIIPDIVTSLVGSSTKHEIGFPIVAQVILTPVKFMGIGVKLYGNKNKDNTFWGVGLGIYFGEMR